MQEEKERFLNLKSLPARLTTEHAAWFLGFAVHEIPVLVAKGLLRPLGQPAHISSVFPERHQLTKRARSSRWRRAETGGRGRSTLTARASQTIEARGTLRCCKCG